jgi:hypothetical protein
LTGHSSMTGCIVHMELLPILTSPTPLMAGPPLAVMTYIEDPMLGHSWKLWNNPKGNDACSFGRVAPATSDARRRFPTLPWPKVGGHVQAPVALVLVLTGLRQVPGRRPGRRADLRRGSAAFPRWSPPG